MSWRRVFRARLYVRDSLWALPLAGALFGSVLAIVDIHIDQSVHPGRLRALLEELQDEVRPEYRAAVTQELVRLDATIKRSWGSSVDVDPARTADTQGIGGPRTQPIGDAAAQSPGAGEAGRPGSRFDETR